MSIYVCAVSTLARQPGSYPAKMQPEDKTEVPPGDADKAPSGEAEPPSDEDVTAKSDVGEEDDDKHVSFH